MPSALRLTDPDADQGTPTDNQGGGFADPLVSSRAGSESSRLRPTAAYGEGTNRIKTRTATGQPPVAVHLIENSSRPEHASASSHPNQ